MINEKVILDNYNKVIRLVESIRCGKVKATLILQKINFYIRINIIAKEFRELGRFLKIRYITDCYTNGNFRREV